MRSPIKAISIHAPQWGATEPGGEQHAQFAISIHAPQWGATRVGVFRPGNRGFQSTHPSGVRPAEVADRVPDPLISIHAPQWGATHARVAYAALCAISIHAPQWGATPSPTTVRLRSGHFNPRTPVGCDKRLSPKPGRRVISIHAPQWGATGRSQSAMSLIQISIHAPQWGATFIYLRRTAEEQFQSTHPSGVRPLNGSSIRAGVLFQSTHPSGVRPASAIMGGPDSANFNPRTPVGCDCSSFLRHPRRLIFQSTHPSGVRHGMISAIVIPR